MSIPQPSVGTKCLEPPQNNCDRKKVETQGAEQDRDAGASYGHWQAAPMVLAAPVVPAALVQVLLAGQLPVEAGEGDGEGLHGTQRVVIVHGEGVIRHTPKLHHDVVGVTAVHDLEIFDGGMGDPAVEIEDVGLGLVVPHWCLVVELDHVVHVPVLPSHQEAVIIVPGPDGHPLTVSVHPRDDDSHLPGAFEP